MICSSREILYKYGTRCPTLHWEAEADLLFGSDYVQAIIAIHFVFDHL